VTTGIATLGQAACAVLATPAPTDKARLSRRLARAWAEGRLTWRLDVAPPDRPAHPPEPALLPPRAMPERGKAGSPRARIALIHALAHIEFTAIDLAWDLVARFGAGCPRAFADDWVRIAAEESLHFLWLSARLEMLGSRYGALPAHDGLWESAQATAGDLIARLSVVPLVLEARGLDVTPQTAERLRTAGDAISAGMLERIYRDEIGHVGAGVRWLHWACESANMTVDSAFERSVRLYFKGQIKPPFNVEARNLAGFSENLYQGLAS